MNNNKPINLCCCILGLLFFVLLNFNYCMTSAGYLLCHNEYRSETNIHEHGDSLYLIEIH